ncbi:hypothetical protein J2S74_001026 [Evansella vedderi]|uniref:Uncharacterized protein n=1 Tax=Evansella vedderi TaxID=38282 RepID=A0ABT9ZR27_9BACI|nr:YlzJ-like family protein [Evansella vedderi]MDQ0253654.1 hypothetical protein [Evansella vedderi]
MILYTYQAQESIFPVDEQEYNKQQLVDIPGGQLLVEREEGEMGGVNYRIVRLLSTDPNMYLDQRYTPGQYFQI